ncbi:MAG: hypothetical protein IPM46_08060 [Flavobacteriales bacterium]|nr:hypothetical protein [Flavobacteriales bacterium]
MFKWIGWVLVCVLVGCAGKHQSLCEFIQQARAGWDCADLDAIIYLTERGCLRCNKGFVEVVEPELTNERIAIVVAASGLKLDISPFIMDSTRVIWDYEQGFERTGGLRASGVVFLRNGEVDTVITLDALGLNDQLGYIATRLSRTR